MNKKRITSITGALFLIALVFYNFFLSRFEPASLTVKEQIFLQEIFQQNNQIINTDRSAVLFARGIIDYKSIGAAYSPDSDPFCSWNCGYLPNDLGRELKKKYPNISSPCYAINFLGDRKDYLWISIIRWVSDDCVIIVVGKSGSESGISSTTYEMKKIDGAWVANFISVKSS